MDLIFSSVHSWADRQALRLVSKQGRALVDGAVAGVSAKPRPQLGQVRGPRVDEAQLSALTQAPWRLLRLDLGGCGIDDAGAAALAAASWPGLLSLELSRHHLQAAGVAALASARWPRLQRLGLDWGSTRPGEGSLDDAAAAALAAATWPDLRALHLYRNVMSDAGAAALAAARWPLLRQLDVRGAGFSALGMAALAGAGWPCLEELAANSHPILSPTSTGGVAALAQGSWPGLRRLCIAAAELFSDDDWAALAAARWPNLRELSLTKAIGLRAGILDLNPNALARLATSNWPDLQKLELAELWNLDVGGLAALIAAKWPRLQELTLSGCNLGNAGLAALAEAGWPALIKLDISSCVEEGSPAALAALLARLPRLQSLNLSWNHYPGALAAVTAVPLQDIRELEFSHTGLARADVAALATADWPRLEFLGLRGNRTLYGAADVGALLGARLPALRRLDLSDMMLDSAGVAALAQGRWPRLQSLNLTNSVRLGCEGLGYEAAARLLEGAHWPELSELKLFGIRYCKGAKAALVERAAATRPGLLIQF